MKTLLFICLLSCAFLTTIDEIESQLSKKELRIANQLFKKITKQLGLDEKNKQILEDIELAVLKVYKAALVAKNAKGEEISKALEVLKDSKENLEVTLESITKKDIEKIKEKIMKMIETAANIKKGFNDLLETKLKPNLKEIEKKIKIGVGNLRSNENDEWKKKDGELVKKAKISKKPRKGALTGGVVDKIRSGLDKIKRKVYRMR